jgi:hypothetical protein
MVFQEQQELLLTGGACNLRLSAYLQQLMDQGDAVIQAQLIIQQTAVGLEADITKGAILQMELASLDFPAEALLDVPAILTAGQAMLA